MKYLLIILLLVGITSCNTYRLGFPDTTTYKGVTFCAHPLIQIPKFDTTAWVMPPFIRDLKQKRHTSFAYDCSPCRSDTSFNGSGKWIDIIDSTIKK